MSRTRERLLEFLRSHQVLTVSVTQPDGRPHAAAVFYAVDEELCLYVLTDPGTQHGRAMARQGWVAGAIQRDRQEWREIQGIQLRGPCRALAGEERARAWELYKGRFSFLQDRVTSLASALKKMILWKIEPSWMRLIDNRLGFGHEEEWTRSDDTP